MLELIDMTTWETVSILEELPEGMTDMDLLAMDILVIPYKPMRWHEVSVAYK